MSCHFAERLDQEAEDGVAAKEKVRRRSGQRSRGCGRRWSWRPLRQEDPPLPESSEQGSLPGNGVDGAKAAQAQGLQHAVIGGGDKLVIMDSYQFFIFRVIFFIFFLFFFLFFGHRKSLASVILFLLLHIFPVQES